MSVKLKPLADRVLIEPAPAETTTASGIIIPDTAQEKPQKGKVVAGRSRYQRKSYNCKSRKYCPLWQICRYRTKIRRENLPYHERK